MAYSILLGPGSAHSFALDGLVCLSNHCLLIFLFSVSSPAKRSPLTVRRPLALSFTLEWWQNQFHRRVCSITSHCCWLSTNSYGCRFWHFSSKCIYEYIRRPKDPYEHGIQLARIVTTCTQHKDHSYLDRRYTRMQCPPSIKSFQTPRSILLWPIRINNVQWQHIYNDRRSRIRAQILDC